LNATYRDIRAGAAVSITTGAVDTEGTVGNVTEGQDTAVAVVLADNLLVRLAGGALLTASGGSEGGGSESEGGKDELHFEG
jgi:hypothetical protein